MVNKMNGESLDLTAQNIARLKELFPEILTDGNKIDFDMLKTVLGEVVETERERYQFTWHGKKKMIEGAQKPSKGTLRPVPDKSKNFDTTENLYIEGDNLEVLKLLQKSYNGKIKMIYIDPPYNTGKEFVYKDNFNQGIKNYLEQTGQIDSEGNRLSTNTDRNGRFHTDWLNMIYARLKLSKNLLKDDGVIFISIDDNQLHNMRKVCDEVFGENNFIINIAWEKVHTRKNSARYFSSSHEYILCYAKKKKQSSNDSGWQRNLLPRDNTDAYKNPDNDPKGPWKADAITAHNYYSAEYKITKPNGVTLSRPKDRYWLFSEDSWLEKVENNEVLWGEEDSYPLVKRYLKDVQDGIVPISLFSREFAGDSSFAKKEIDKLLGNGAYFSYPKPTLLIKRLLQIGSDKDSLILDFFSGSATTADSVLQLNSEDGGSRKFIMVQLPELLDEKSEAYKDGYRTICDIGEERIRHAGEKIKAGLKEKQKSAGLIDENIVDPETLDVGFKVLKLCTSNIREWNVDFANLEDQLDLYETPFVDGRSELDIVYEIMLKQGLELTYPIETFEVNGKKVYDIAFGSLFICLSKEITPDIAKAMIARRDEHGTDTSSVIFSDAGFNNDSDKLNSIEILKDAGYPEDNLLTI
ncbi:site-specific DNA-methyltransferase [Lysinibacillus capsici]|uniref:site-specific DNA-methyltransferase n=1 Tax=Lysinibacillus capsici TaxID=2115968 RepID=UPI003081A006|nr:site-specific DNA-methyltransferase [Lysinibacillus capsici]